MPFISRREQLIYAAVIGVPLCVMLYTLGISLPATGQSSAVQKDLSALPRAASAKFDIRLVDGRYAATFTGRGHLVVSGGQQTIEFGSVDASKPIFLGEGPTDPPVDPGDPDLKAFQDALRAIPAPSSAGQREAVAKLYGDTADLTQISTAEQLKMITNALFSALTDAMGQDKQAWRDWKDKVDQAASFSSIAQHRAAWKLVSRHLGG